MFQRTRWSAVGAAVAVVLGAGFVLPNASAAVISGERAVFVPIVPCRLFDTRPAPDNVGPRATPLGPSEVYTQQVGGPNGHCNIPTDATAVAMNVTAVGGTANSYLTVYPSDATERPQASNLNWTPGSPAVPNKVDVKLSNTRAINLFNLSGSVNVLADVVGYYADHNHDDRYHTKAEIEANVNDTLRTEVLGPFEMTWEQFAGLTTTTNNGCAANTTPSSIMGEVPIRLPIGAKLISVDVVTLDTAGPTTYSVELLRSTLTGAVAHYGTITLGGILVGSTVVHTVITPPPPEIAATNDSYTVRVGGFGNSFNAFCQMTVTYDTKP